MTNATDALRALIAELARDVHYAIADDGLAPLSPPDNNAMREAIQRVLTPERIAALATPAGSASGEVPFAVVGGVEFDSPQALCAAHAELQSELSDYRMAANAEAREVDRRGERIAALQAEVAQLQAALAEARRDASLWRRRWIDQRVARYQQRDGFTFELAIASAEDDANRIDYEFQQADAALHQRKENGHAG